MTTSPGAAPPEEPGGGLWSDEAREEVARHVAAQVWGDGWETAYNAAAIIEDCRESTDAALGAPRVRQEVEARLDPKVAKASLEASQARLADSLAELARVGAALAEAERERDDYRQRLAATDEGEKRWNSRWLAVTQVLEKAEAGEFATAGRDFGRGVAEMARRVRAALAGVVEPGVALVGRDEPLIDCGFMSLPAGLQSALTQPVADAALDEAERESGAYTGREPREVRSD